MSRKIYNSTNEYTTKVESTQVGAAGPRRLRPNELIVQSLINLRDEFWEDRNNQEAFLKINSCLFAKYPTRALEVVEDEDPIKWLHFNDVPMNRVNGKVRHTEPWISCDEVKRDSGYRKGIEMMNMDISIVAGIPCCQADELVYLHFKGQNPEHGIRIGHILNNEN